MSWDIFSKSKIQYFLQKLKDKFVQKETGKGLSTNDFDNTYKSKVDKIDVSLSSISGNPISITGLKSNQLAVNPIITFEPIQAGSGTPSPVNQRPISGYDKIEVLSCGKNTFKCDFVTTTINGVTFKNNGDGTVIVNGTATANTFCPIETDWTTYDLVRNHNYFTDMILTGCPSDGSGTTFALYMRSGNSTNRADVGNGVAIYYSDTSTYYPAIFIGQGYTANNLIFKPMFRLATISDATFEPYHKTTDLSESLGQTVYGGTLDVRTGKFTVTHGVVDLGTKDWFYHASTSSTDTNRFSIGASAQYLSDAKVPAGTDIVNGKCDIYQPSSNNQNVSGGNTRTGYISVTTNGNVVITDTRFTSISDLKAALNGIKFSYELKAENKFTIQLTPHEISLLKDYAYVSTNGTNIAFDYHNGELASLADVSQLGETVNEISQAFQDGCDEIMQAVTAKGQTPASNSPDDISAAIGRIVALPGNMSSETVTMASDVTNFQVSYDKNRTVEFVIVIPLALVGANYEQTFLVGKLNFLSGSFDQYAGTTINYNSSAEQMQTAANAGSMSFNSSTGKITINTRGSNYKFKNGDIYAVLIVYSVT